MYNGNIYVGILEDDKNYSNTLTKIINNEENLVCNFVAARGEQLMPLLDEHYIDVLIMDIRLPDVDGSDMVKKVKKQYPTLKCLMCTTFMDSELIVKSLKNGAAGYILKTDTAENIIKALKEVYQGAAYMSKHVSLKIVEYFQSEIKRKNQILECLSDRELEVLDLLSQGKLYKEVATELDVSIDTIKKHSSHIYRKLEVQNKTEALNIYNKSKS